MSICSSMLRMIEWMDGWPKKKKKNEAACVRSQSTVLGVRPSSLSLIQRVENSVGETSDMPLQPVLSSNPPGQSWLGHWATVGGPSGPMLSRLPREMGKNARLYTRSCDQLVIPTSAGPCSKILPTWPYLGCVSHAVAGGGAGRRRNGG